MKFEDALSQMRLGKKITHELLGEDVYLQLCRVGVIFEDNPEMSLPISIVKMKGEYLHPDMAWRDVDSSYYEESLYKPCKHGNIPQINLLLLMSEDWVVLDKLNDLLETKKA